MFVQTAQGITSDGTTLTLKEVTPSTLYFSDRPKRIVGHMTTADFVDIWAEGDNSFQDDPPNAVLAFLEPGDNAPEDAVVVIQHPRLEDGNLPYGVNALEGSLPTQAGPLTLFIAPHANRTPQPRRTRLTAAILSGATSDPWSWNARDPEACERDLTPVARFNTGYRAS